MKVGIPNQPVAEGASFGCSFTAGGADFAAAFEVSSADFGVSLVEGALAVVSVALSFAVVSAFLSLAVVSTLGALAVESVPLFLDASVDCLSLSAVAAVASLPAELVAPVVASLLLSVDGADAVGA